ncbi:MAG: NYN domain-containing protein [Smithellaceae bacterium]
MHILIDGYNLIRQSVRLRRFERQSLEAGRNALIAFLSEYQKCKDHKITVVFDGWLSGPAREERDYVSGIHILYSERGVKADDVIKRISAHADEEIVVVSSDREIASYAARKGRAVLSSAEFESIAENASPQEPLMNKDEDDDDADRPLRKKGAAYKLSRSQRRAQNSIRKL